DAGVKPSRVVLQHDVRYLWVGNNSSVENESGVTVIETTTTQTISHIRTGLGHHEIALNDDDTIAFVTNKDSGWVSVVEVRKLDEVKRLSIGTRATAIAYSSLSKMFYIVDEANGAV